jgi:hypothetical protein
MDLPVELRLMIFEYTIAPTGEIYPLYIDKKPFDCRIYMGIGYDPNSPPPMFGYLAPANYTLESREKVPPPDTTILHVSKQCRDEGLRAGWEGMRRCFIDVLNFVLVAGRLGLDIAPRFNFLGRIELRFTNIQWLYYFGVRSEPYLHRKETFFGCLLANLSSTTELNIRFRDPSDGWHEDPWARGALRTACQTFMIDWIMALAFPQIKHFRAVKLTGYVKKPQKAKWESLLYRKCAGQADEFDHVAAVQDILATHPSEL